MTSRHTFVDIMGDPSDAIFMDPVLCRYVTELEQCVHSVGQECDTQGSREAFAALMEIGRCVERIRLEAGSLSHLDSVLRRRTANALQWVMDLVPNVESYASLFPTKEQPWVRLAMQNVQERLDESRGGTKRLLDNRDIEIPEDNFDVT